MNYNSFKEYQESIRQEFIKEGRPVTARERYYTLEAIKRDYPDQFPASVKEISVQQTSIKSIASKVIPPQDLKPLQASLSHLTNKVNKHLDSAKKKESKPF